MELNIKKVFFIILIISIISFFFYLSEIFENPLDIIKNKQHQKQKKHIPFHNKNITIDILVPFPEKNINITIESLKRWNQDNKLPCGAGSGELLQDYYENAISNLVFYQNFGENKNNEKLIMESINNTKWIKCFNSIKFVYAYNIEDEDEYPKGVTSMFYKYFKIGPHADYFFWFEMDVNPIKPNWLIQVFKTVILQQEARNNKPFYILGSNNRRPHPNNESRSFDAYHINGNAIYWRDISLYNNFLINVENWVKSFNIFDIDIEYYIQDPENWLNVTSIYQELIFYEIIQNLGNHESYTEDEIRRDYPRTYFVHS